MKSDLSSGRLALAVSATAVGVGFALLLAHAQCALAQDSATPTQDAQKATQDAAQRANQDAAQRANQDAAQRAEGTTPVAASDARKQDRMRRTTVTGSNILRVRPDESLPLLEVDRTYIDRSGATTTPELLRTIPQIQNGR